MTRQSRPDRAIQPVEDNSTHQFFLMKSAPDASRSWWVGHAREGFQQCAEREWSTRMRYSQYGHSIGLLSRGPREASSLELAREKKRRAELAERGRSLVDRIAS